jgi:hypothetical protein
MSGRAHVIEIDRLVLVGVDPHDPVALSALVTAELRRQLATAAPGQGEIPGGAGRAASEIARGVVQSVQGGGRDG